MSSVGAPPSSFSGEFLTPRSDSYEAHRRIFLELYDHRFPAVIARCRNTADVQAMVRYAREQSLEIAVRAGKHSMPGYSIVDQGIVIDLAPMTDVAVDRDAARFTLQPGVTASDLLSRDPSSGIVPITGLDGRPAIVGLSIHGGRGFLSRQHGWASDHILGAEMVTATGEVIEVSATSHPDLLYGLRGAGSNFGIVTRLELQAQRIPPVIQGGFLIFKGSDLPTVIPALMDALETHLADSLGVILWITADENANPSALMFVTHCGDQATADRDIAFLRGLATPVVDRIGPTTYAQVVDSVPERPNTRFYWEEQGCEVLDDRFGEVLVEHIMGLPAAKEPGKPNNGIYVEHFGPGYRREPILPTCVPRRRGASVAFNAEWSDPALDERYREWVGGQSAALLASGVANGVQTLNFNYKARVVAAYGEEAYARLSAIKAVYDPENVFHLNHNVEPAVAAVAH